MAWVTGSNNYQGSNKEQEFIWLLVLGLKDVKIEINLLMSEHGLSTANAHTKQYGKKEKADQWPMCSKFHYI